MRVLLNEIAETVKIAFDSLRVNKMRSFLASLGVVIGISFVIIMGWILAGLDTVLEDTVNMIGVDMLYVDKWDWSGGKNWKDVQQRKAVTIKQANELCENLKTAELATPVARKHNTMIKYNTEVLKNISVTGTRCEFGYTSAGSVILGSFFSKVDEQFASKTAVIGYNIYDAFFKDANPIGQEMKIEGVKFTIIGVIKKQGTVLMDFMDNQIFIPLPSFVGLYGDFNRGVSIAVKAGSKDALDEVKAETEGLMRSIRNNLPGEENDFSINETKSFEETANNMRLWIGGIGIGMTILSFIVGIIGIMNIMFVSVTERTKEIGIRKAIGAKKRVILFQFIVEAAALCFAGAIISFIICSLITYGVATKLPDFIPEVTFLTPYISPKLLLIASFVSIFVGMLAGLIPAMRAANLDPIEALRYE